MGAMKTKEEIIARLDYLDKEEINLNKQLRELQIELNGLVPVKDRVKVKAEYFDDISDGDNKSEDNEENEENIESEDIDNVEDIKNVSSYKKRKNKNKKKKEDDEEDERKQRSRSKSKKKKH